MLKNPEFKTTFVGINECQMSDLKDGMLLTPNFNVFSINES